MTATERRSERAFLIDIEGVLVRDKRYQPVPGSVGWLNGLSGRGISFRLVSNNTTHRPEELVAGLQEAIAEERLRELPGLGKKSEEKIAAASPWSSWCPERCRSASITPCGAGRVGPCSGTSKPGPSSPRSPRRSAWP